MNLMDEDINEINYIASQHEQCIDDAAEENDPDNVKAEVISYCLTNQIDKNVVLEKIHSLFVSLLDQCHITSNKNRHDLVIRFPKRGDSKNSQVDPFFGTMLQYESNKEDRQTLSFSKNPRRFAVVLRVMAVIYQTLEKGEIITKRSIYYRDPSLFGNQEAVNSAIEQISRCIEIPRTSLGVIACPKGFVAGPISWMDSKHIETNANSHICPIPALVDNIICIKCRAIAVLIVEKESIFMRLAQSSIANEVALITGRGVPDYATRMFVKLLDDSLTIPIVGLFDSDAYGIFIAHTYKYGSKTAAIDSCNMACPNLKWLGIRPSDMEIIKPERCSEITENEIKLINKMLSFQHLDQAWRRELEILLTMGRSAEIESLLCDANDELIDTYLPQKFAKQDWI